jgi:menaquinone-dependent protoporphyrinogen oxidase
VSRILIAFGTTDGQTGKIARYLGATFRGAGATTDVIDLTDGRDPDPDAYDLTIVAASIHAGGYQRQARRWVTAHAAQLNQRVSVFVSVCLGVLQHDPAVDRELLGIRERFFAETGWRPVETKVVAGALNYTQYNLLKRWMMRRIVSKAGGDTDMSRDYEYTDWNDLRAYAETFLRRGVIAGTRAAILPRNPQSIREEMRV